MPRADDTREKLLAEARKLFWQRGYSNVGLREIAANAGVDVALISRYFGGKSGLFEATLDGVFDLPGMPEEGEAALIEALVDLLNCSHGDDIGPSTVRMLTVNADDREIGELVRRMMRERFQAYLERILGDPERAALLLAVIFGICIAERTLRLDAIARPGTPEYAAQLRHMLNAAIDFGR